MLRTLTKGPFQQGLTVLYVVVGAAVILNAVAILWLAARGPAVHVAIGVILLQLMFVTLVASRVLARVNDLDAAIQLQSSLDRWGWASHDVITDGAAASASFQWLLAKVLRTWRPQSILELGTGQTTHLLAAYQRANGARIRSLEEDRDWVARVSVPFVEHAPRVAVPIDGRGTTDWYDAEVTGTYDLVLVDGPVNSSNDKYPRAGIVPHLPTILAPSFIVIFDDTEREGEQRTVEFCAQTLNAASIRFVSFEVYGVKHQSVFCSPDLSWLRSI